MFQTQLAQIATALPVLDYGKILGQPKSTIENFNAVMMRGRKSTRNPSYANAGAASEKKDGVDFC